jgi:hypothetical protein
MLFHGSGMKYGVMVIVTNEMARMTWYCSASPSANILSRAWQKTCGETQDHREN